MLKDYSTKKTDLWDLGRRAASVILAAIIFILGVKGLTYIVGWLSPAQKQAKQKQLAEQQALMQHVDVFVRQAGYRRKVT